MILEQYAYVAEIIASVAVFASLIFVAFELRKNTRQSRIANWTSLVDRYNSVYQQTNDIQLANLIAKGRQSYHRLTEGEKISFGHYMEQMCLANQASLVLADDLLHESAANRELFRKHISFHLGFAGSREWYDEFDRVRGFPPKFAAAIRSVLDEIQSGEP